MTTCVGSGQSAYTEADLEVLTIPDGPHTVTCPDCDRPATADPDGVVGYHVA